jgi:FSR family fosmidomycin resistance protein-like MFS transporter
MLLYPSSGAFVSLSQAVLMDMDPGRREQNMARWTFAGSLGVAAGPLALGAAAGLGIGWRGAFMVMAALAALLLFAAWRQPFPKTSRGEGESDERVLGLIDGFRAAWKALRRGEVVRWLALLQFSDFMLDTLYGLLALYFVDVVGVSMEQAALAVAVWTVVGLAGDFLLIPLLEKVRGLSYLRVSAAIMGLLFPAFLLVPSLAGKLVILGALGFLNSGWYAILQAQLYGSMPGQSGAALAVGNIGGLIGGLIPLGLGILAQTAGLHVAMWALLAGPIALFIGIPRRGK